MKKAIILTLALITMSTRVSAEYVGTNITGCVKNAESGLAIEGAEIVVYGPPPAQAIVADDFTDRSGWYWLGIETSQGFQEGTYTVWIFTYGYDDLSPNPQNVYIKRHDLVYLPDFLAIPHPPPTVDAGSDISTTDSFAPQTVQLNGSVTDSRTLILIQWSKISGPGNVSFLDSSNPKTSATFDALGQYELQLWALDDAGVDNADTVIVQIGPVNTNPVANDDTYSTTENVPLSVGPPGVLANDGDEQNDALQVVSPGAQSIRGTLVLSPDGSFTYTPAPGFWGIDTYTYKISDGKGGEATATITFEVAALNLPPLAMASASSSLVWVGDSVGFDGSASYDPDGVIVAYDWDFGEGGTGTGSNTTYTYSTPGFYTVWLTVWDDGGLSASDPVAINVNRRPLIGSPNEDPVVDAGPDQHLVCDVMPCATALEGSAMDPDDYPSPLIIEWTRLGGPGTVTFDNPSNPTTTARFPAYGTYVLALRADDGEVAVVDQVRITVEEGLDQGQGPTACSPVAYWNLDEGSGITALDSSGNGYDATLVGSPQWVDGPAGFGKALAFNRFNYARVPNENDFNLTDQITVSAWANIEKIGAQWSPIMAKGNTAWRLSTRADQSRFHFAVTAPQVGPNWVNGETEVALGEWHHIAGTYNGSEIHLYIDGVEDSASPVVYAGPISENDLPVWIGGNAAYPGQGFTGKIDDVRIYGCALTQVEIFSVMGISMPPLGAIVPLPPAGHIYHGVYPGEAVADLQPLPPDGIEFEEDGITLEDLRSYEQHVGKTATWVYFSHNWFRDRRFPLSTASWIRDAGSIPYIRLMLRSSSEQDVAEPVFTVNRIIRGNFDDDLHEWMREARDFGSALIVEYGTEVNGEWFSWNGSWNGAGALRGYGDPSKYDGPERFQDAYRHIIQIAREENALNITWVFHVDAYDIPDESWNRLELYYPGDEWIDWLGVSVYGALDPTDDEWPLFRDGMDAAYARLTALSPDKPIVLLEFGVTSGNPLGDQAKWAEDALTDIVALRWPRLIGFSWWNESWENDDDSAHNSNLRIQDNPALAAVFQRLVGDELKVIGSIYQIVP